MRSGLEQTSPTPVTSPGLGEPNELDWAFDRRKPRERPSSSRPRLLAFAALAAADGKQTFLDNNCNRCHAVSAHDIEATVKSASMKGPDLSKAGKDRDADWLEQFLAKEVDIGGKKHSSTYRGTDEDRRAIAEWLAEQRGELATPCVGRPSELFSRCRHHGLHPQSGSVPLAHRHRIRHRLRYSEPEDLGGELGSDDRRVVCIAVSMQPGGVVTKIGEAINAGIADIGSNLPVGLEIEEMFYQPQYVARSISNFVSNLGQAFFFVVLVMLLFAGWRLAVIVGVLVPSAIALCFSGMPVMGVQLEMMSIAALIIALGLLVDNAVVVSEQILNRRNAGDSPVDAMTGAVKSLQIPLLAASCTTIAAFSTIALAPGAVSEFTYSLFAVVTLTLLASWLLSITIIPLLCYYFLKPLKRGHDCGSDAGETLRALRKSPQAHAPASLGLSGCHSDPYPRRGMGNEVRPQYFLSTKRARPIRRRFAGTGRDGHRRNRALGCRTGGTPSHPLRRGGA